MAEETPEERDARISEEVRKQYEDEAKRVTDLATGERENQPGPKGLETWDEYWDHAARVPGVFGDLDTTAGGNQTVAKNEEVANLDVAAVDAAKEEGVEEVQDISADEARRQLDVAGDQPSAEEADKAAEDSSDKQEEKKNEKSKEKPKRSRSKKSE
jgi:hypothetical protein